MADKLKETPLFLLFAREIVTVIAQIDACKHHFYNKL